MTTERRPRKSAPPAARAGRREEASATPDARLDEADLKELIGYQLAQASIVTLGVFDDVVSGPHRLKTVEYTMLALIRANPGLSAVQLRKALGLSAAYVTTGLEKLGERGYILREVNQNDRRAQHLRLSKPAEKMVAQLTQGLLDAEQAAFHTLTLAEQRMLAELLHKLACARPGMGPSSAR